MGPKSINDLIVVHLLDFIGKPAHYITYQINKWYHITITVVKWLILFFIYYKYTIIIIVISKLIILMYRALRVKHVLAGNNVDKIYNISPYSPRPVSH